MIYPSNKTKRVNKFGKMDLLAGEVVLTAESPAEARGELELWEDLKRNYPAKIILLNRVDNNSIVATTANMQPKTISLTNYEDLSHIFKAERFLIDITVLRHNVWAPLIKFVKELKLECRILYVEPSKYKGHPNPSSDTIFDLTTSFESLLPLPGFSKLIGPDDEHKCLFVTMLGFEGSRPIRLLAPIEPNPEVIPVIGVPGFNLEYPTYAVTSNKDLLTHSSTSSELRHAKASCPFEAYKTLEDIRRDNPEHYMYIAPVGTKPHAVGAILYALDNPDFTEIMYDHPIGKKGRTSGKSVINVYSI
jgi:hypothetical protein